MPSSPRSSGEANSSAPLSASVSNTSSTSSRSSKGSKLKKAASSSAGLSSPRSKSSGDKKHSASTTDTSSTATAILEDGAAAVASTSDSNASPSVSFTNIEDLIEEARVEKRSQLRLRGALLPTSPVPKSLLQLRALHRLYLSGNGLTSLPSNFFTSLKRLRVLDLQQNKLTSLPEDISSMDKLKVLLLNQNRLSTLPDGVGMLRSIVQFELSENRLESLNPRLFELCTLRQLVLSGNHLTALPPDGWQALVCLEQLDLRNNYLSEDVVFPEELQLLQQTSEDLMILDQPQHEAKAPSEPDMRRLNFSKESGQTQSAPSLKPSLGDSGKGKMAREKSCLDLNTFIKSGGQDFKGSKEEDVEEITWLLERVLREKLANAPKSAEGDSHRDVDLDESSNIALLENDNYDDYRQFFFRNSHSNFFGSTDEENPIVVSILREPDSETGEHRALLRTQEKDVRLFFPAVGKNKGNKKGKMVPRSAQLIKALQSVYPLENEPREIVGCMEQYLDLEEQLHLNCHKFGVVHCVASPDGCAATENSLYTSEPTPAYERFLELIGDRIELKDWPHYTAGLDTRHDGTGTHSLYTTLEGLEIMFHVSSLLPNDPKDEQRIERKRHIGNDICMIVFVEEDAVFDPAVIQSNFVHVVAAVKVLNGGSKKKSSVRYEVSIYVKGSVIPVRPWLQSAPFHHDRFFANALLIKLVNMERSTLQSPVFAGPVRRTRRLLLAQFESKLKLKSRTFVQGMKARTGGIKTLSSPRLRISFQRKSSSPNTDRTQSSTSPSRQRSNTVLAKPSSSGDDEPSLRDSRGRTSSVSS
mmetsp:Transcript_34425/g.86455  ORF Transcript_34425/g.86455 Transcript_34425/m.86455 type:complete len:813 (-) Transcript_34425:187-2625(-)